jgi:diamine N-acetyltransferase
MRVAVRAATIQDYDALCEIIAEVDALHVAPYPDMFRLAPGPARERAYVEALLADESVGLFVAEVDGKAVGLIHLIAREVPQHPLLVPRRYVAIEDISVRAGYRRAGIGRTLMAHAEDWARARGIPSIELNVYEFNDGARAFYEELGYRTLSRRMRKKL